MQTFSTKLRLKLKILDQYTTTMSQRTKHQYHFETKKFSQNIRAPNKIIIKKILCHNVNIHVRSDIQVGVTTINELRFYCVVYVECCRLIDL